MPLPPNDELFGEGGETVCIYYLRLSHQGVSAIPSRKYPTCGCYLENRGSHWKKELWTLKMLYHWTEVTADDGNWSARITLYFLGDKIDQHLCASQIHNWKMYYIGLVLYVVYVYGNMYVEVVGLSSLPLPSASWDWNLGCQPWLQAPALRSHWPSNAVSGRQLRSHAVLRGHLKLRATSVNSGTDHGWSCEMAKRRQSQLYRVRSEMLWRCRYFGV